MKTHMGKNLSWFSKVKCMYTSYDLVISLCLYFLDKLQECSWQKVKIRKKGRADLYVYGQFISLWSGG